MNEVQIKFSEYTVELHLKMFRDLRRNNYNNVWTLELNNLARETKQRLISYAENVILNPERTANPVRRVFNEADEPIRHKITRVIVEMFEQFNQERND